MQRRDFMWWFGGGVVVCTLGCDSDGISPAADAASGAGATADGASVTADAATDACAEKFVKMHDTYAQALYLDGTLGPLTGTIQVAQVVAGVFVTLDFWHGHGGVPHRFTMGPTEFAALKAGQRITVGTTTVEGHAHTLFVDPKDESYRVPNAPDVEVSLGC